MTRLWCRIFGHTPVRTITHAVQRSAGQFVIMESHVQCTRCLDRPPDSYRHHPRPRKRARW